MMIWSGSIADQEAVSVTVSDKPALLAELKQRIAAGKGFSVATLNLDHVEKLRRDPGFLRAYVAQTHVTADGNPIVWLSRLAGQSSVSLVPGSELVAPIAHLAAEEGVPIGLFGTTDASLSAAAGALKAASPGLRVSFSLSPSMGFDPEGPEADRAIEDIRKSGARVIFLALGAPKQERFAAHAQKSLPEVGFLSIGAGLDFISGTQQRAPAWMRAIAAEWLWRMLSSPRRLAGRYARCFISLPGLTVRALASRHVS